MNYKWSLRTSGQRHCLPSGHWEKSVYFWEWFILSCIHHCWYWETYNFMCPCTLYRTQQLELERLRKAQRRVGDFLKITFYMIHVKILLVVIIITNHHNHYNNQSSDNSWVWGKKPKGGHLHLRGDKMIWRLCWLWWRGWYWYVLMIPGKKS